MRGRGLGEVPRIPFTSHAGRVIAVEPMGAAAYLLTFLQNEVPIKHLSGVVLTLLDRQQLASTSTLHVTVGSHVLTFTVGEYDTAIAFDGRPLGSVNRFSVEWCFRAADQIQHRLA